MLEQVPKDFQRVTGVIEGRRKCTNCQHTFPTTNDAQRGCPRCQSMATVMLVTPVGKSSN